MKKILDILKPVAKALRPVTQLFVPNKTVSPITRAVVASVWVLGFISYWSMGVSEILPTPVEIWNSFKEFAASEGLIGEMWTSMKLCFVAVFYTIVISLIICYATVMPMFRPIGFIVSKFRFISIVGLSFLFTVMLGGGGYDLKVSLLTFGMTVFFVTQMMGILSKITTNELNHARTLGMSEWRVVWEVTVLSNLDKVFDVIRSNFAIAWMMITFVEGISRADGGVGTMLLNQNKHLHLDAVFAIQFLILFIGIALDYMVGAFKRVACPHAHLTLSK